MQVIFKTSDNLLEWKPSLIQTSEIGSIFVYIYLKKVKKLNYIDSELNAIERINLLRDFNEENGIIQTEAYYHYAKLAIMEMNDKGFTRIDEHYFKNTNENIIKIIWN